VVQVEHEAHVIARRVLDLYHEIGAR